MSRMLLILLAAFLMAARGPSEETKAALLQLQTMDLRVAAISQRLATNGTGFCKAQSNWSGIVVHDAAEYDRNAEAARAAFGLGVGTAVSLVVEGSPADRAGIRPKDVILKLEGRAVTKAEMVRDRLAAKGILILTISRAGKVIDVALPELLGCASRVIVVPSTKVDAGADGQTVRIRTAIIEKAQSDSELAFIIGHEMAHNILGHPALLDATGRRPAQVLPTEIAADKLSVKLMAKAGYDPTAAARFWARIGKKGLESLLSDGTHQRLRDRIQTLEVAAAAVTQ
jgi:beta-barrel assembly-enhancing protease